MKSLGIFYFRRDLRLNDNYALQTLQQSCKTVMCIFCLDPRQIQQKKNKYYSPPSVRFMFECLDDLNQQIQNMSKQKSKLFTKVIVKSFKKWFALQTNHASKASSKRKVSPTKNSSSRKKMLNK